MRSFAHIARTVATGLALTAALALGALMFVPAVLGMERYVITSGSMSGTYDMGSVVLAERVPVSALRTGDVITYAPPAGKAATELVTHRIVAMLPGTDGKKVFVTKGDANPAPDAWTFSLDAPTQARVTTGVPHLGRAFILLGDRRARMALIGLPALLIAVFTLVGFVRDARAEGRRIATA